MPDHKHDQLITTIAEQAATIERLRRAGNELVQSRLHHDICISEYKCSRSSEDSQRVSEASCRVADAIEAWERVTASTLSNPDRTRV